MAGGSIDQDEQDDRSGRPRGRPRRGPAPTKHVDLLWAAARLFAERGVGGASTRDIAAAAGTTERTLFKRFGSKDGLVQAVIAEAVVPHLAPASLDGLRAAIEAHGGDVEVWHVALLEQRAAALAAAPELVRLLLVELLRDEALRARFAERWLPAVWAPLTGLFGRLQREGRLSADIPVDALTRTFLSLNLGYLIGRLVLAPGLRWDDAAERHAIARLFARGAVPGPG
ncbi:MAG: helix-turn-helix domain-containing protein [Lautropia sp.]